MTESETVSTPLEYGTGATDARPGNPRVMLALGAAVIVAATFCAYAPALRGEFVWDDDYHVSRNALLRSWAGLQRIWFDVMPSPSRYPLPQYYPMTHTSFWIEYRLWGLGPTGYHVTNVLLHAASALLIWLILRKLALPGAWLAAAVFAVHPINVESVAWIAERKNVLSAFFFFASLYVYLRWADVIPPPEKPSEYFALPAERERVYALAAALFVFALLSKTVTASLPAVVLLIMWWKRGRIAWRDVVPLLPLFALGILAALLTGYMEYHRVGARGPDWDHGFVTRCLIAGKALWFYVYKLIVPWPLIFNYPRWQIDPGNARDWLPAIAAIIVLVGLVIATATRRIGRGPLAAVLYYAGTLFPALGFVNVFPHRYSFVADHFVYLSCVGLIALAVCGATWLCVRYLPRDVFASGAPAAAGSAVLLIFLLLSLFRSRVFAGPEALWRDTLAKTNQQSWFAANNYGLHVLERASRPEHVDAAEEWFKKAIRLKPDHAEAHYNLGLIAERRGEIDDAKRLYRESLRLRPDYELPILRLGSMLQAEGMLDEAEEMFTRVVELRPDDDFARLTLGKLLEQRGKEDEALDQYEAALAANPDAAAVYLRVGTIFARRGRGEEALQHLAEAARLDPKNPAVANNVGTIFASAGYWTEARVWFERALSLSPRMPDALTNLGIVAARQGKPDEARQLFQRALDADPDFEKAKRNLADLNEGRLRPATTQSSTAPAAAGTGR